MSGDEQGYSGYTNYETWCVSLWLDNDEGSYRHWWGRAQELKDEAGDIPQVTRGIWTKEKAVLYTLADEIEASVKENAPSGSGMFIDLTGHALGVVNWEEVAGSFTEE